MRLLRDIGVLLGALFAVGTVSQMAARAPVLAQPFTAKATVTVGTETFTFSAFGVCTASVNEFSLIVGDATKGERFELNLPHGSRAKDADVVKPTADGTYTSASLHVIPAGGAKSGRAWHAGGTTGRRPPADLTVILKNNRRAGDFSGRTDGSGEPRLPIKGSFTC